MPKPEPVQEEILCIEECVRYIRAEYTTLYPNITKQNSHTLGNIPNELHANIRAMAKTHDIPISQAVASLWDFYQEYESDFAEELKTQRAAPKPRRT